MREMRAHGDCARARSGMSSGLTYTPGMYADTAELVALCAVVGGYGGYYSPAPPLLRRRRAGRRTRR